MVSDVAPGGDAALVQAALTMKGGTSVPCRTPRTISEMEVVLRGLTDALREAGSGAHLELTRVTTVAPDREQVIVLTEAGARLLERQRVDVVPHGETIARRYAVAPLRELSIQDLETFELTDSAKCLDRLKALSLGDLQRTKQEEGGSFSLEIPISIAPHRISFDRSPTSGSFSFTICPGGDTATFVRLHSAVSLASEAIVAHVLNDVAALDLIEGKNKGGVRYTLTLGLAEIYPNVAVHNVLALANHEASDKQKLQAALNQIRPEGETATISIAYRDADKRLVVSVAQPRDFPGFEDWLKKAHEATLPENIERPAGRGGLILLGFFDQLSSKAAGRVMEFSRLASEIHAPIDS